MSKAKKLIEDYGHDFFVSGVEVEVIGKHKNLPKEAFLAHQHKVDIKWEVYEEHRKWGIKSIMPVIADQTVQLTFIEWTDNEDIEHVIDWEIKDAGFEFQTTEEIPYSLQIMPIKLEIDFEQEKSVLILQVS